MRRVTITLPDDLEAELERYLAEQDAPPTLTTSMQAALREYLRNKRPQERGYRPPQSPFSVEPIEEKDEFGEPDVSLEHDKYFGL